MDVRIFRYGRSQKTVYLMFLVMFMCMAGILFVFVLLDLLKLNVAGAGNPSAAPATIIVALFLVIVAFMVNMMTPDIRVREDGLQLIATLYRSDWLNWDEIEFVRESILSRRQYRILGIGAERISPIYYLVGMTQVLGGKAFLITERIQGYEDLVIVLEEKRPDLFQR